MNTSQPQLPLSGKALKIKGIQKSLDTAERVNPGWQDKAYSFLCEFVKNNAGEFLAEDVRNASKGFVPDPVSKRAWGGIIAKAAHKGIIKRIGYDQVTNPTAHQACASVWQRV